MSQSIKKPAQRPVFRNRRSGSKIAEAITWQPEPEQQPEQQRQEPEQLQQASVQQPEQRQEPERQEQPGLLFCHKR